MCSPIEELKARNNHVASFKGFPNNTTPAEAFRTMRPHEARSCYFHNSIAYFAFSSDSDMLNACSSRILHDDRFKLDGRLRILYRTLNSSVLKPSTYNFSNNNKK